MNPSLLYSDPSLPPEDPLALLQRARVLLVKQGERDLAKQLDPILHAVTNPGLQDELLRHGVDPNDWYQEN